MAAADDVLDPNDWADSARAGSEGWAPALRTAAQLCLSYPTPCCLLWGERSQFF